MLQQLIIVTITTQKGLILTLMSPINATYLPTVAEVFEDQKKQKQNHIPHERYNNSTFVIAWVK